jgi:membrane protein required for colicin V production
MHIVDIFIALLLILNAVFGYRSGLIRSVASLIGLAAGIAIAGWNYTRFDVYVAPIIHNEALRAAVSFIVIALVVMVVFGLIGLLLKKVIHGIGLGWLDSLLGLCFGLLRGALVVTLCIGILLAFYPDSSWLESSRLAGYFLRSVDVTIQMQPGELRKRTERGLEILRKDSKQLLHPK